jgi:hypothetical protein
MPRKNSDLVLDQLRMDLKNTEPGFEGLRWEIAKGEVKMMLGDLGPKRTSVGIACLIMGIALGIYGVKYIPRSKTVKSVKFAGEALKAQRRLNKIMIEEYYRFDEALKTEQSFLDMMSQDLPISITLSLDDEGGQRHIKLSLKLKNKKKESDG